VPYLFKEELRAAEQRILASPHLARPMKHTKRGWIIRAVLFPKTEQWVYYRFDEQSTAHRRVHGLGCPAKDAGPHFLDNLRTWIATSKLSLRRCSFPPTRTGNATP
jgi:hypothetical protein